MCFIDVTIDSWIFLCIYIISYLHVFTGVRVKSQDLQTCVCQRLFYFEPSLKTKLLKYSTYFRSKWLLYWLIVWAVWAISYPVATGEEEGSQGEAQPRAAIAHMTIICKDVHNVHIYNICIVHILYTVYIYIYISLYVPRTSTHACIHTVVIYQSMFIIHMILILDSAFPSTAPMKYNVDMCATTRGHNRHGSSSRPACKSVSEVLFHPGSFRPKRGNKSVVGCDGSWWVNTF